MGKEQSKSHQARVRNNDYSYLKGNVLDIGCGPDPINLTESDKVRAWDLVDGDAQYLVSISDETYDAVFSSHCLEHLVDVPVALKNWSRVLKKGGRMLIYVPSWTFYERRQWPSRYNGDHKASFDLVDPQQRPAHPFYTMRDMRLLGLQVGLILEDARLELDNYDLHYTWAIQLDQTQGAGQAQVAFVFHKP
jgi:predicted SAM-dependent methyltransferase